MCAIIPQLLHMYKNADPKHMYEIVAGQETWIYRH